MKKILLAVAVIALAACGKAAKNNDTAEVVATHQASDRVAYVVLDSLRTGYNMFTELGAELEAKAKAAETELTSRGRALERKMADAQNKVEKGLVTRAEAQQLQESLARDEQSLMQLQSTKQEELAEQEMVMMNKIMFSIQEYIAEFNSDLRYGMILTTSNGAPILHADPSMDITAEVLKGLNEKYAASKKAEK
jgi:outer membrane protein